MTRIVLHVDRLALRGFTPQQHEALLRGLREALALQLADPAAVARIARLPAQQYRAPAARVALDHGLPARAVGERLGGGIVRSLGR